MKKLILMILFLLFSLNLKINSQWNQDWATPYNGSGNSYDILKDMAVDNSGNVYVTGKTWSSVSQVDIVTIKYNSSGQQQWVQIYEGVEDSYSEPTDLTLDGSGNVYITGVTNVDIITIKYSTGGTEQWAEIYNGGGNDQGNALIVDNSGNVYVTGCSENTSASTVTLDIITLKYNSSGTLQWDERFDKGGSLSNTFGHDVGLGIAIDENVNHPGVGIYVVGYL